MSATHRFDELDAGYLKSLTPAALDEFPFGIVELDAAGIVLAYNTTESEIVGFDPKGAIGKSFFDEIAPCTNTPDFAGRFRAGVAAGKLSATFEYRYDGQRNASVWIHMTGSEGRFWVVAKRV